jgi:hypothetical protein
LQATYRMAKRARRQANDTKHQVFVSHASTDKWLAITICEKIEKAGDMVTANQTSDIFISHAISDSEIARDVAHTLEAAGLSTFYLERAQPTKDISEVIWEALSESRALVAIVSPETGTSAMGMVEIGAATAWNKPVFVLIHGRRLPNSLSRFSDTPHIL